MARNCGGKFSDLMVKTEVTAMRGFRPTSSLSRTSFGVSSLMAGAGGGLSDSFADQSGFTNHGVMKLNYRSRVEE